MSHLNKNKFRHGFQGILETLCTSGSYKMNRKFIVSLTVPTTAMKALQHKDIGESIKKEKQEK